MVRTLESTIAMGTLNFSKVGHTWAVIILFSLLTACHSQSPGQHTVEMQVVGNACADGTNQCPLSGMFKFKDTRCWITCQGQGQEVVEEMKMVGESSYCHVVSGNSPGLYKCSREGLWMPATSGRGVKPLTRVKKFIFRRRRRYSPPPPNKAPYFTSCPGTKTVYASANRNTAAVTWTVSAADDRGVPTVTRITGSGDSGHSFPEGVTAMAYRATDSDGATATCSFSIQVYVYRCNIHLVLASFPHGTRTCSGIEQNIYGSTCSHVCDTGYILQGNAQVTCTASSTWNTAFPTCHPVSCSDPGPVMNGDVLCVNGHVFPHSCAVQCRSGFQSQGTTSISCGSSGAWSGQLSPCVDVEAPTFPTGCPADQLLYSGPLETPVNVTWPDPVANDNSGSVTLSSDLVKGSFLGIGVRTVTVTATDSALHNTTCTFIITVQSRKCQAFPAPSNGQMSCTMNHVEGSECTVSCDIGYRLKGAATLMCLDTQLWNASVPVCEAIMCPVPTVQHGAYQCLLGFQHPASCVLTCSAGFQVVLPSNIQCLENATWTTLGSCRDIVKPQFPNGCPNHVSVHAAPFGTDTLVSWTPPAVTDNSGAAIIPQPDVTPGASFPPGVTTVTYVATDDTGNTESCQFSVEVTVLSCGDPTNALTSNESLSTVYTCAGGHVYGAVCTVSCVHSQGFVLVGNDTFTCSLDNSTYPPTTEWRSATGSTAISVCRADLCPVLQPSEHGSLSCHLGSRGWDCLMSCHTDRDLPYWTNGYFYCINDFGTWRPRRVPDCIMWHRPLRVRTQSNLFYFTGDCNSSLDQLRQNFVTRMKQSIFKDACVYMPLCSADNVKVTCGSVSSFRGKREIGGEQMDSESVSAFHAARRSTRQADPSHYYHVTFDITGTYDEGDLTPEEAYQMYSQSREKHRQYLLSEVREGRWNVAGLVGEESGVVISRLVAHCPQGTLLRDDHPTSGRFSCVGCSKGHYLNEETRECLQCPVGFYTEEDNATSCQPCPSLTSPGVHHISQCLPY